MTKQYKCPWCGNISDELIGFIDQTEWDAYQIDSEGELEWQSERDTYHGDIVIECMEYNKTTMDYTEFEVIDDE